MCGWLGVMEVVPKERERFKRREEASQRKRKRFKRREEKSLIIGLHFGMGGIGKKKERTNKRGFVTTRDWDMDRDIFMVRDKLVLTVQIQNFYAGLVDDIYGDFEEMEINQDYVRLGRLELCL
ncbi:uncharacterized protein LOC132311768 isoform X1 [Cornus florida]|uniref:uncharacterized protein LOC132311768 isoform X1 n=1 Tax=Cornus florida TaxID=4283 RepID=UPI002896DCA0|nr:uncharacterized protein LOC132311768 isoform X1 [Cornus florida]XP_059665837.1 uncharacterized protein LOC132311768 isoform X1 [Cornus florida]